MIYDLFGQEEAQVFISNILVLSVHFKEDMLAAVLVSKYDLTVVSPVIDFAIASRGLKFLQ